MKKIYVSIIDRSSYEIHRAPHHVDGEKSIEITEDEFVYIMRTKAEWKKTLSMISSKYMESEIQVKK